MSSDGHLTLSERFDRIDAAVQSLSESYARLSSTDAADQQRLLDHERRITAVEGWQTWALRAVVGAVVTALVAAVVTLA